MIELRGSNMPEFYPTDRASLERDSDMEFFIASGPGVLWSLLHPYKLSFPTGFRCLVANVCH